MEIHFYEFDLGTPDCLYDWRSTKAAIDAKTPYISTTQMCLLSTTLLLDGYRIFVHQYNNVQYEITLQNKGNTGNRAVRVSQNIYAMWASNVFRE